jgi:hypothetical protein
VWPLEATEIEEIHKMRSIQSEYAAMKISPQQLLIQMSHFVNFDIPSYVIEDASSDGEADSYEVPPPLQHSYGPGYETGEDRQLAGGRNRVGILIFLYHFHKNSKTVEGDTL